MSTPSGSPGLMADSMSKVREAVKILQDALPGLQTGSDPHKEVLSAIQKISKYVPASAENPGIQQTQLRNLAQQSQKDMGMDQVMRALGGGGSGGAPGAQMGPGGAAAMPPPMAA